MKKKALFIDRDGTLIYETEDEQIDSLEKLEFLPKVFKNMHFIQKNLDYELVMVTNQDGLGTASFPEETFWPVHNKVINAFEKEGVIFDDILIDRSFPYENLPTPQTRNRNARQIFEGRLRSCQLLCNWRPFNRYSAC
jgi:imidazoleglycerol-phosphate dehydratase / histidinol-phosphatase